MEIDQVIAAVKKETGIKLSAADPVLAAAAINAVIMEDTLAQMDHSMNLTLAKFAVISDNIDQSVQRNQEAAKLAASNVVSGATEWLVAQLKDAAQEATAAMLAQLRQETAKAEAAAAKSRRFANWSGAIGAGSLALILGYGLAGL